MFDLWIGEGLVLSSSSFQSKYPGKVSQVFPDHLTVAIFKELVLSKAARRFISASIPDKPGQFPFHLMCCLVSYSCIAIDHQLPVYQLPQVT